MINSAVQSSWEVNIAHSVEKFPHFLDPLKFSTLFKKACRRRVFKSYDCIPHVPN
jgi:hypothetical protein